MVVLRLMGARRRHELSSESPQRGAAEVADPAPSSAIGRQQGRGLRVPASGGGRSVLGRRVGRAPGTLPGPLHTIWGPHTVYAPAEKNPSGSHRPVAAGLPERVADVDVTQLRR